MLLLNIFISLADTPVTCFNDQVLGRCNTSILYNQVKYFKLLSPNIVIDEDGYSGTWTFAYTQAIEIRVSGFVYMFYFDYQNVTQDNTSYILSYCNQSFPAQGWSHQDGMNRAYHACVKATNVQPLLSETVNKNQEPLEEARIVHFNNTDYHLYSRRLQEPVPHGKQYLQLKQDKKLKLKPLGDAPYSGDILPASFDWRNVNGSNFVPPAFDQLTCGSCYACATTYMMMSRMMIANNTPGTYPVLSIQHLIDCNFYSQGCQGGFGEHVGKFSEDFGILTTEQYGTYANKQNDCHAGKFLGGTRYFFQATQALGGYEGAVTDPLEMQWELYRYGPFAVSVNDDDNFDNLDPYGPKEEPIISNSSTPDRHYFYYNVNHLVLLVGWVEEQVTIEEQKVWQTFWIIQNSFGESWGINESDGKPHGAMRIIMGRNAYAIESQPIVTYWREAGAAVYEEQIIIVYSMSIADQVGIIGLSIAISLFLIFAVFFIVLYAKLRMGHKKDKDKEEVKK